MQSDSTHYQPDMDVDSPADFAADQTPMTGTYSEGGPNQEYAEPSCAWPKAGMDAAQTDSCVWPQAKAYAAANSCAWPKASASCTNPKQHNAADYALADTSMQERLDTGRHATASDQSAANEEQASGRYMHSMSNSPAPEEQGHYGTALGQHANTGAGQYENASGLHRQSASGQDGPRALWQGQLGQPGSPGAPMQLAASTAAMLSLVQQANQPGGSMQQGKRKQAGECLATHIPDMPATLISKTKQRVLLHNFHCCYAATIPTAPASIACKRTTNVNASTAGGVHRHLAQHCHW